VVLTGGYGKFGGPFFAGNPLDRGDGLRSNEAALQKCLSDSRLRIIGLRDLKPLMNVAKGLDVHFITASELPADWQARLPWVYLGADECGPITAVDLDALDQKMIDRLLSDHIKAIDLRSIAMQTSADNDGQDASILALAKATIDWHRRHGFCAECGGPTNSQRGGFARQCADAACAAMHFPRTDPVVIMLAVHGDQCLLGRSAHFLPGVYSALAGFMEPGESIEEAVARELSEEAGLTTNSVRYFASQPWPFPSSLMIGCVAEVDFTAPVIDDELEDARWFSRKDLARIIIGEHGEVAVPTTIAIGYQLIKAWLDGHSDKN